MANPDDEVQGWFDSLPYKVKKELAGKIKEQADSLAVDIKAAAPRRTGALAESVKVRRQRDTLNFVVTAGGDATTKTYGRNTGYEREVAIGSGDTAGIAKAKDGAGVSFDYALANEYGTVNEPAQPFFYNTFRARQPEIQQAMEDAVADAISKA
jgi:HK97 gp10 family phage protein